MNEFIEKLIGRLEELQKLNYEAYETAQWNNDKIMYINASNAYANAITEINQLAEEYKQDIDVPTIDVSELFGENKIVTNADRIRSMSDEELADMLHNIGSYVENGDPMIDIYIGENKSTIDDSFGFILEWLQSEAE